MSILAALLLIAQPAPAAAVPDRFMLDAFRAVCARVADVDRMRDDALAAGWGEFDAAAEPRLHRMIEDGRRSVPAEGRSVDATFRSAAFGPDLFLVVTRVERGEDWRNNCRFYHFGAARRFELPLLEQWMGRTPTDTQEVGATAIRHVWDPGWQDGMSVEAVHISAQNPAAAETGFSGNVLIARAVGGAQ